jgi:hypothetical protein
MTRSLTIPSTISRPERFVVNTDSKSISNYSIASDASLTLLETTPVNAPTAPTADAGLSPDGTTLSGLSIQAGTPSAAFAVDRGTVTELSDSPTPGPADP